MPLFNRWQRKPPQGTPIDPTRGLAQELQLFYPLNELSGPNINDYSPNRFNLTSHGFGSTNPWGSGALQCTTSGAGAVSAFLPAALKFNWPMTIAIGVNPTASQSSNGWWFGIPYDNAVGSPFTVIAITTSSSNKYNVAYNNAGSSVSLTSGTSIAINVSTVVSFTVSATFQRFYINGVRDAASTSSSISNPNYSSTSEVTIGYEPGVTRNSTALIYWCAMWNRVLSDAEHAQLSNNPWQIFMPPQEYWLFSIAAASSYTPWIYGDQIQEMYG